MPGWGTWVALLLPHTLPGIPLSDLVGDSLADANLPELRRDSTHLVVALRGTVPESGVRLRYPLQRMSSAPKATSGPSAAPKVRRTRDELRDLVLQAGRDVLLSEGLGTGAEHLTFKRVLAHVEATTGIRVTNASVIRRIWDNQEEFQLEVIRTIVDDQGDAEVEATSEAFDEALAIMDLSTPELRRASLAELIRVTCARYIESAAGSGAAIQMALATYMSANLHTSAGSPLVEPFQTTNDRLTVEYMELYKAGLELVGWRVKPGLSLEDGAATVSALAEGVLMRKIAEPAVLATITQVRPMDGAVVEWTLLAIGMDQIVDFFAEPDPDWVS